MKVLLYNFGDFHTPFLETQADLIQQHLDQGDEVVKLVCNSELPICRVNPRHQLLFCSLCLGRRAAINQLVHPRPPERSILNLKSRDRRTIAAFSFRGDTIAQLKRLTFEHFDIGWAVAAVVIDDLKDPEPDLRPYRQKVQDWIGVSLALYLSALNTLEDQKPDRVYVMNGRWCYARAVLRACQVKQIDCHCHDLGGDKDRFILVKNRMPHDIAGYIAEIEEAWQQADPATREAIGSTFYEEKARGIDRQWFSYVTEQKQGKLPDDWDASRRNVSVFLGSEFEYAAIDAEFEYPFYRNQNEGVMRIAASLEKLDAPVHLNVRVHPHLKGMRNSNLDELLGFRSPKATIIPPESPVSSYDLLWACEKVLTFGSTMGVEATYWGKPSILAGTSFYQSLGATYDPATHEELIDLLLADLRPKPKDPTLKYGYHELNKGIRHVHYQADAVLKGKFKGIYVQDAIPWYWRVVLKLTFSRLYSWFDLFWQLHRRFLRRRLGIPVHPAAASPASGQDSEFKARHDYEAASNPRTKGSRRAVTVSTSHEAN